MPPFGKSDPASAASRAFRSPAMPPAGPGLSPTTAFPPRSAARALDVPPCPAISRFVAKPARPPGDEPLSPAVPPPSRRGRGPFTPALSRLIHFPQAPGAGLFISLRRRALAPFACLRAKGARRGRAVRTCGPGPTYSFPSIAGRSLRSLGYAPFGARRSRAVRTCGPALFIADSSSVAARGAVAPSGPEGPASPLSARRGPLFCRRSRGKGGLKRCRRCWSPVRAGGSASK